MDIKGPGDDLTVLPGNHKTQVALKALSQQVKELGQEVLAPPVQIVHRGLVQIKHDRKHLIRDSLATQHLDLYAALVHLTDFTLNLVAPFTAEVGQIVIKGLVGMIQPLILNTQAFEIANLRQGFGFVRQAEIDMHRGQIVAFTHLAQGSAQDMN